MKAEIKAICISNKKGIQKRAVDAALLIKDYGIEGDAHAGNWHRQVSILNISDIDWIKAKGLPDLEDGDFGENLIISGIDIDSLGLGSIIKIGKDAELKVTQRGKECHDHCAIYAKAGDCIMPRHGIFTRVIKGGEIRPGDSVEILQTISRDSFQCVILTASDRCSRGETQDTAGPAVAKLISEKMDAHIYATEILPDDRKILAERLSHYANGHSIDLVIIVGGTGFSPRDVSPEAVRDVAERLTPGLDEVMRAASLIKTPHAILSRATSGICKSTLLMSLPGSEHGATENLDAILPALSHGLRKLRGDPTDCGR